MSEIEYLDLEELLLLTRKLGAGPVRDVGLLDSSVGRPRSSMFGHDAYPTLELKAAALLHSICKNHALVDGNKRLAWFSTVAFLALNGYNVELDDEPAFNLVIGVAEGKLEVEDIAAVLAEAITPR
ncbi:type II toxin-antitoxin system death-on-curing family toxin [Nocardioides speluncae]|uniref:type II toxin-antitoxin system death-on-curing family toxin n=1 Tax=Nocardioides speluncae TaxID=2670337 RepID=UPI000D694D8B|nr:type II toxin-antitoxin system death-on-curing family toxin [Nocardioides speluncae]